MSTCHGHAVVAFPGLPPIHFPPSEGWILPWLRELPWGYVRPHFLPPRTIRTQDGRKIRLGRKERSRLRTNMSKWSDGHRGRYGGHGSQRDFRTLEFSYCDY